MKKRIFSLILAVYLTASLLAVPVGAAGTAPFSDVTDSEMAADVECLRLLGVLDGYADGSFRPNATLTRAQFCKMAVYAMNASAELGKYRAVTVFPDVKPGHWASSYINLASKGKGIILGFADGQFHPEATVTAGQAVTILMRLLDYKDEDVGAVWPDGYLAQAAVIGLTNGLSLSGGSALNRGQAARLFVNLLRCEKKDETSYAASIAASIVEHTMLVSSSASAGDGTDTGMQVGNGSTYRMANKTSGGLLMAVAPEDADALLNAARCGVGVLASAHAGGMEEAQKRPVLRRLMRERAFDRYILLGRYGSVRGVCDETGKEMEGDERGQLGCGRDGDDRNQRDRLFALGR